MTGTTKRKRTVSYTTNCGWFDHHNNVELMSSPTNKKVLPEEIRQFLVDNEFAGIRVTLTLLPKKRTKGDKGN